ncbi:RND family efflux transporter, MFP subunit [Duganella sp. CF402]|jgi:RND family efflux transporter MFP subunit|uniref:efflux RND transporter periplasmic adaptor subunit n=1 Tax=unclassified Duganella TaxID=2636909 RepID=UPI0008C08E5C|nr:MULTISPECIES: HlyD family secretion protein [unclassified Duganella]RZT06298.1 RND family efflux transporter MFP subunit [Duganella sp. BK701]SEM68586.1 RND family efflux transporter, MFP subunit [Duganella sp. CF402]
MNLKNSLLATGRFIVTMIAVAIAATLAWRLWQHYEVEPWTRDGRVKADVVQVAPDVTGQVTAMLVHDNQQVKAGQVLFEVDRARFELALRQAEAAEQAQRATLEQAIKESRRNSDLRDLVSAETREQGSSRVDQLRAALAQAVVARDTAKLNLERTRVVSPVNGTISNLDLRAGSYVSAGRAVMALIDSDSYYVEGYFEETKLPAIQVGDAVVVLPMGESLRLKGHVESLSGGVADRDRSTSANLLSSVNPTFNWVRLAQRIPVRIKLDALPAGARLIAGQTVTVDVQTKHS